MSSCYINFIGTANPEFTISQNDAADIMAKLLHYSEEQAQQLYRLYHKAMIEKRHIILDLDDPERSYCLYGASTGERMKLYEKQAHRLAIKAITNNIPKQKLQEITHLITVSCTGMHAPGLDIELIQALNLPKTVHRTCIYFMGCYAAFNALKVAHAICHSDPNAVVLIVDVELCSLHIQAIDNLDQLVANALFADGAAAVLLAATPGSENALKVENFYCDLIIDGLGDMTWNIRDKGFDMRLSAYIPKILSSNIREIIDKLLRVMNLQLDAIDWFAIHPGGIKILMAIERALGVPREKTQSAHDILRNYGNMSSVTIFFVLKQLMEQFTARNHQNKILSMAFGPGLTVESAVLEVHRV